jgi:hypothetical protein
MTERTWYSFGLFQMFSENIDLGKTYWSGQWIYISVTGYYYLMGHFKNYVNMYVSCIHFFWSCR